MIINSILVIISSIKKKYIFLFILIAAIIFQLNTFYISLASDGTEDTTFSTNVGTGAADVEDFAVQSDGKLLVSGFYTTFNGLSRKGLVRLNTDGTEDTSFHTNLGTDFTGTPIVVKAQSDGKIIVAGSFSALNGATRHNIIRLNSDGTEDTTFAANVATGPDSLVVTMVVQPDDKILIGGYFNNYNGVSRRHIARLNADGTEDSTFATNIGSGFLGGSNVQVIRMQQDNKILVGGNFTSFNGNARNRLVRLNTDGSEDTSFYSNLGSGFGNSVYSLGVQSTDQILVGGQFVSFNGNTRNRIVRLNDDGTEDTTFYTTVGTGFGAIVSSIYVQQDDSILLGGNYASFNSNARNRLVRLNPDGTEDTAFYTNITPAFSGGTWVNTITVDGSDNIVAGGDFLNFKGVARRGLVRLTIADVTPPNVSLVTSSTANGTYGVGSVIPIQVMFDEVVYVTGTPQITLETGDTDAVATYSTGSGSTILIFNYTVAHPQVSSDLDYTSNTALTLAGGTIKDASLNDAVLTLPVPGAANSLGVNKALVIEGVKPILTTTNIDKYNLTLTYDQDLSSVSIPATTDFVVLVNGVSKVVNSIAINGNIITLILNQKVSFGDVVTISYTSGVSPIEDPTGNDADALVSQSVTNSTGRISSGSYTQASKNINLNNSTSNLGVPQNNNNNLDNVNANTKCVITKNLKKRSRGDEVKCLQKILKIYIDGIFGIETKKSVINFQSLNNLKTDGIVGPLTRAKINI